MFFAQYVHPEVLTTVKPIADSEFVGQSLPHFRQVCRTLAERLTHYPSIPVRRMPFIQYRSVHTDAYLQGIECMARDQKPETPLRLSLECTHLWYALPAYEAGLGGIVEALDRMRAGTLERAYVFGTGGHHAHRDWGHGYCLFHPLAAGVRYAQSLGFKRILIVDWDIHHGDGTQDIFAHDPDVRCISIHDGLDLYMGAVGVLPQGTTIAAQEVGQCNIPVIGADFPDDFPARLGLPGRFYRQAEIRLALLEALESLPWTPDLVCIFSGYDGHREDQGGAVTEWIEADYAEMTREVLRVAKRARCPVLSMHGGGYRVETAVSSAAAHIEVLADVAS